MTSIDFADPYQVFNRLAQIQHDTDQRIAAIDALTAAQTQADREFDQLQQLALNYLAPKGYPVVTATAYDPRHTTRRSLAYCLTIVDGTVLVKPYAHTCEVGDLTAAEINAALTGSAESRPHSAGHDSATSTLIIGHFV
jgi:hypothetical protein